MNQSYNFIYLSVVDRSIIGNLFEIQVQQLNEEKKEVSHFFIHQTGMEPVAHQISDV